MYTYIYTCTDVSVVYKYTCTYVSFVYKFIYAYVCVYMYICMYIRILYMYIHIFIYIYIQTHIWNAPSCVKRVHIHIKWMNFGYSHENFLVHNKHFFGKQI